MLAETAIVIEQERPDSPEAIALLSARDAELDSLYPPEACFRIPTEDHVSDDVIFLMARENGVAVACGALQKHSGYAELKSIFVIPEARGRRLARRIVAALEALARGLGFSDVRLETGDRSPAAARTYEQSGYVRCDRFGNYPDAPLSVFMAKRLTP